jgi:hypothetical protein
MIPSLMADAIALFWIASLLELKCHVLSEGLSGFIHKPANSPLTGYSGTGPLPAICVPGLTVAGPATIVALL